MNNTPNYNFNKPLGTENYDIDVQNENWDITDAELAKRVDKSDYVKAPGYGVTAGAANAYTLTLNPAATAYTEGMGVCIKIHAANTGAATINVNGLGAKTIVDGKGNALTAGKLPLNGIITLRYNGANFILQGEGASGNATASDLLSGKTATTGAGEIIGTMPNKSGVNLGAGSPTAGATSASKFDFDILLPSSGYVDDTTKVHQTLTNLIPANLKAGVTIPEIGFTGIYNPSPIVSIQRGVANMYNSSSLNIAISSVDTTKAIVKIYQAGFESNDAYQNYCKDVAGEITGATTLNLKKGWAGAINHYVAWEVIEFLNVKAVQKGTRTIASGNNDVTISSVNLSKSMVFMSFESLDSNSTWYPWSHFTYIHLVNSTTLRMYCGNASNGVSVKWQVLEFN